MNRAVWIARFLALALLIVFALLMMNLHRRLIQAQRQQAAVERVDRLAGRERAAQERKSPAPWQTERALESYGPVAELPAESG
jgi:hypothetical protein